MKKANKESSLKEPITAIEEVKNMLAAIMKNQDQILKKMDSGRSVTMNLPLNRLFLKRLPNLNLNN